MQSLFRQAIVPALLAAATGLPSVAVAQSRASAANYVCEGTMAKVATTSLTGDQRTEWQVNFRMSVNRAAGSVIIFAVSGGSVIKPGRHTLAADSQGRMAMSWTYIDRANKSQPVTMVINRAGEFEGTWSESNPTAALEAIMNGVLGPEAGGLVRATLKGNFSGICWQ